jgi:hypothetical protein
MIFRELNRSKCKTYLAISEATRKAAVIEAAVDYFESTPVDRIHRDRSFLEQLTRLEKEEERQLQTQLANFYWSIRQRQRDPSNGLSGGFENSWTLAPRSNLDTNC